jgi:uncharacterized protein with GYD domain
MPAFIALVKFTREGAANAYETTKRAASFRAAAKKMGVKVTAQYWTLGRIDGVLIFEAPDDETAMAAMLHLGSLGNVKTQTMRAFTAAEMDKIFAARK